MIDTLELHRAKASNSRILDDLNVRAKEYAVVTLHRPSNVDQQEVLAGILDALAKIQQESKVVFPIHPRTRDRLASSGLLQKIENLPNIVLTEPLGYLDFLRLMSEAKVVITDSGGIQEETTILGVPCLTVRENTERPVTVTEGTNILVGIDTARILTGYRDSLSTTRVHNRPKLWDGYAAERIVQVLLESIFVAEPGHRL